MQLPNDLAAKLEGRLTLSIREAAELLSISLPTAYDAVRRQQLPSLSFGERALRVPVGSLLALCGFEDPPNAERTAEAILPTPAPIPFPNGREAQSYEQQHTPTG